MGLINKKGYMLLSILVAATILGILALSVLASDDVIIQEEKAAPKLFRKSLKPWLGSLDDNQLTILKQMIKDGKVEIQDQLELWGKKIYELNDEQRETLRAIIMENKSEVKDQFEQWGIKIPTFRGLMSWLGSLTDEQKEELQSMKQEYLDSVKDKLEEWDIETPEGLGLRAFIRRGFSKFRGRDTAGYP